MTEKEKEYAKKHAKELRRKGLVYNEKKGTIDIVETGYIRGEKKKTKNSV